MKRKNIAGKNNSWKLNRNMKKGHISQKKNKQNSYRSKNNFLMLVKASYKLFNKAKNINLK